MPVPCLVVCFFTIVFVRFILFLAPNYDCVIITIIKKEMTRWSALLSGERHMAMNVHNLLHINASVRNHGPLWAHSAFEFEDANGELTALFHGTQNIDMQVTYSL